MPMYDLRCQSCGVEKIDVLEPITCLRLPCGCGGRLERVWLQGKANGVIDDSIPGGLYIKNGLCNADGSPRRYDSHTEIRKEAEKRGLVNRVIHVGSKGSDRSKHTVRWV